MIKIYPCIDRASASYNTRLYKFITIYSCRFKRVDQDFGTIPCKTQKWSLIPSIRLYLVFVLPPISPPSLPRYLALVLPMLRLSPLTLSIYLCIIRPTTFPATAKILRCSATCSCQLLHAIADLLHGIRKFSRAPLLTT